MILITPFHITSLDPGQIFVFGSNLAGRHGRGAAWTAVTRFGAIQGQGVGLQGSAYAIPTKDGNLRVLSLPRIKFYVDQFIRVAHGHQELQFLVTEIGCGLAGYTAEEIAPLFAPLVRDAHLTNVALPECFWRVISPFNP